jgi:catalase
MDKKNQPNDGRDKSPKKPLTAVNGRPVAHNENIKTAGKRGGAMLDDTWYLEKMSQPRSDTRAANARKGFRSFWNLYRHP